MSYEPINPDEPAEMAGAPPLGWVPLAPQPVPVHAGTTGRAGDVASGAPYGPDQQYHDEEDLSDADVRPDAQARTADPGTGAVPGKARPRRQPKRAAPGRGAAPGDADRRTGPGRGRTSPGGQAGSPDTG